MKFLTLQKAGSHQHKTMACRSHCRIENELFNFAKKKKRKVQGLRVLPPLQGMTGDNGREDITATV